MTGDQSIEGKGDSPSAHGTGGTGGTGTTGGRGTTRADPDATARFFGYGSLVNRATHDYAPARRARLAGWRRVWVHVPVRPVAFLSVEPAEGCAIAGLVADVPGGDWAALDAREHAYIRHPVAARAGDLVLPAQVYAVPRDTARSPSARNPILLSYLDTVVQGFLDEYGEAGVADFFASTTGWHAPVADDRANPRYPRARALSGAGRALVDHWLARLR